MKAKREIKTLRRMAAVTFGRRPSSSRSKVLTCRCFRRTRSGSPKAGGKKRTNALLLCPGSPNQVKLTTKSSTMRNHLSLTIMANLPLGPMNLDPTSSTKPLSLPTSNKPRTKVWGWPTIYPLKVCAWTTTLGNRTIAWFTATTIGR